MRITTLALAASVLVSATGAALAQPSYQSHSDDDRRTESQVLEAHPRLNKNDDPAGVIDGTNPNPNPTEAGGILSRDALVNR